MVRCNRIAVAATSRDELLQGICRAVSELGFRLAWVGLVDEGTTSVRPVAQVGFDAGYLETLGLTTADEPRGRGPTGTAIREGRPVLARRIATDEHFAPWRADAVLRGYGSSAAIPLLEGNRAIGALNLYATEADAFGDDELALLEEAALDIVVGLNQLQIAEELHRARARLSELDRYAVVGRLAASTAHDFNNLLTVIGAGASDLRDASRMNEERADEILDATARAANLSRQLLSLTRRAAGISGVIEVDAHVRGMTGILARLAGPQVALQVELGVAGVRVRIDGTRLEQVLANLVVNARDAMPRGGTICVRTVEEVVGEHEGLAAGSYVALSVSDTGTGIAAELLPQVFDESFTTKGEGGNGLGLATVARCASEAGGRAHVVSALGQGTTVTVVLPLVT